MDEYTDPTPDETTTTQPVDVPKKRKKKAEKKEPCLDCPDYTEEEELIREKVLQFRSKGYNNNQVASLLRLHKEYVDTIK